MLCFSVGAASRAALLVGAASRAALLVGAASRAALRVGAASRAALRVGAASRAAGLQVRLGSPDLPGNLMRWSILRPLLHKEVLRHLANRGGIALVLLLVVASMLLSFFRGSSPGQAGLVPGVRSSCCIDYEVRRPPGRALALACPRRPEFVRPLSLPRRRAHKRQGRIGLRPQHRRPIQLRGTTPLGLPGKVWIWHPGSDASAMAPFEIWFWKESLRFTQAARPPGPAASGRGLGGSLPNPPHLDFAPLMTTERSSLAGGMDPRSGLATSLVMFGLFFVCVYLLPSLTCEERERGVLLAQALSPASTREILAAKFLFYPAIGLTLAALLAGTC